MNKTAEKTSPITGSVATASVVATRTLTSSTTTKSAMPATNKIVAKDSPSNNPKSHPKTLDIPGTPSKKSTTISAALVTNGVVTSSSTPSKKADKGAIPTSVEITANNKMVSDSPRRVAVGGDNRSKERQQETQNNMSPTSSLSSSSSSPSSASTSGIHAAQFAAICREVAQVREEHLSIRKCLSERDGELGKTRMALRNIAQERDILRNKVSELEHMLKHSPEMYSHVASILSNSNNPLLSGNSRSANHALQSGFQTSSSTPSPSSSKNSPEEMSTIVASPSRGKNNSTGHYAHLSGDMKGSTTVSSPVRNIVQKHQQNQKLTSLPSSTSASHSRPNIVSTSSVVAGGNLTSVQTIGSPRKYNGNEGNLGRKGCFVGVGGMEEMQKVGGGGGRVGGGNVFPCSPRPPSPNISNNINSQESHQANHNNKNLHQQHKQHSMHHQQQSNYYYMNNMKQTTTTFTTIPADKNKSIYYSHEQGPRATPPPSQYTEYHNGNGRNVNGNDIPAMTNSNNNNNHLKSTCTGGGGGGGGYHQHDYHQNQHHLSQSGITGLDLMLLGPDCSTKVVEHLVHPVAIESSVREIQHTLVLKGVPLNGDRLREVEIEIDRLNSRIDHLRSQNDVLTLNLEDAKGHADRLTVLLGKYESNNVALQLALRYSDQMSDAYEVLLALLETELGQVVTSLHAAGQLHVICAPPGAPPTGNNTSGAIVVSKSTVTSSGNNNNSNDNSPSENAQPPPSSPAGKSGMDEQRSKQCGNNRNNGTGHEIVGGNNNDHHSDSPDNNNGTTTSKVVGSSPVESTEMMMVAVKNCNDPEKIISPTSPSSSTPSSATAKAMNLVEQARRNRMAAEQAARFLLSRFSSASMHPFSRGVVLSPTGSDNNNGRSDGDGSSFHLRPTCQSNSTTSINSVSSNLSNISGVSDGGQESHSLSSPSLTAEEKDAEKQQKLKRKLQKEEQEKSKEQEQTSNTNTDGVTDGKEVAINGENMRSSTAAAVSGTSPTSSSATFRAPFSPNGNGLLNSSAPIITSLLPLLRNAAHQQSNHPSNGTSQEAVSAAIESTIRRLISTLKAERDAVKQTVMELESESLESLTPSPKPSSPYYSNGNNNNNNSSSSNATPTAAWSPADARKLDLETAVLMQELMAMKEERAELRAQLFLLEKEKGSLELRLRSHESQEEAYRARINYLKSEIMDCKSLHSATTVTTAVDTYHQDRNRNDILKSQQQQQQQQQQQNNGNNRNLETIINNNNNNQNVNWEREALLKKRIHELASTLEKVTVSSQVREKQNQEMINELNRANGILMQTLDVAKKKYQNRIKKMEDQIVYVSERHAAQLKLFGEKMPATRQYH